MLEKLKAFLAAEGIQIPEGSDMNGVLAIVTSFLEAESKETTSTENEGAQADTVDTPQEQTINGGVA